MRVANVCLFRLFVSLGLFYVFSVFQQIEGWSSEAVTKVDGGAPGPTTKVVQDYGNKFTIVILQYKRLQNIPAILSHYRGIESLEEILLVWNAPTAPSEEVLQLVSSAPNVRICSTGGWRPAPAVGGGRRRTVEQVAGGRSRQLQTHQYSLLPHTQDCYPALRGTSLARNWDRDVLVRVGGEHNPMLS